MAAKSAASDVYKSPFLTKVQRAQQEKDDAANFAARSVPARLVGGIYILEYILNTAKA